MAYSDSIGDNAELLKRTLTHMADFSGRSRRTEVIYYWIAAVLLSVTVNFTVTMFAPAKTWFFVDEALRLIIAIPMFALFVRRVHDQDRSGWWGLLLPFSFVLSLPLLLTEMHGDVRATLAAKTSPFAIVSGVSGLAILVLCLLPGTDGPNRFGPDPRLE